MRAGVKNVLKIIENINGISGIIVKLSSKFCFQKFT